MQQIPQTKYKDKSEYKYTSSCFPTNKSYRLGVYGCRDKKTVTLWRQKVWVFKNPTNSKELDPTWVKFSKPRPDFILSYKSGRLPACYAFKVKKGRIKGIFDNTYNIDLCIPNMVKLQLHEAIEFVTGKNNYISILETLRPNVPHSIIRLSALNAFHSKILRHPVPEMYLSELLNDPELTAENTNLQMLNLAAFISRIHVKYRKFLLPYLQKTDLRTNSFISSYYPSVIANSSFKDFNNFLKGIYRKLVKFSNTETNDSKLILANLILTGHSDGILNLIEHVN